MECRWLFGQVNKSTFQFFLILHYIIKVWRGHFFNHLAGALMCGVGCVAALGYCVLDMIGSRKLDKNHVFNIKSQPLVRDELKYFIDINVIFIHNRFQRNTRIDSLQSVFSNKKNKESKLLFKKLFHLKYFKLFNTTKVWTLVLI